VHHWKEWFPYARNAGPILTRRHILRGAVCLAGTPALACRGYHTNLSFLLPAAHLSTASSPAAQGSLTVTTNYAGTIPSRFMGLSYEKEAISYAYFHASNHNLIALFRRLGSGVLRLGGGSVDQVLWNPESEEATHAQVSPANITALAGFLQATGWSCLYGINLATSTPALAAAEVAYAVAELGSSLLGIAMGNEPDEYGIGGSFFAGDWTFRDFLKRWDSFRTAILQAAPHVQFTGPETGGANHIFDWTFPYVQAVTPSEITLMTQHYYRASGANTTSTAPFLISPDPKLNGVLANLNAGAQRLGVPYRISECNSFANGGAAGVSDSYASSLWAIDFLFSAALGGSTGINMHGGGSSEGYEPIADHSGAVLEVRPEYYGLLFFALVGPGTLLETQLSVGTVDVTAYAVRSERGGLNLMLVNKDTVQDLTITIETNQPIQTATMQTMTGPSLSATSGVTIQGAMVNNDGSFAPANPDSLTPEGTQTTCFLPALSAVLISIT
jgi:FlaG/FlaF family flagellin (archaellin)